MSAIKSEREHPTILNEEQYVACWKVALPFLKEHGSIRNKQLREVACVGYDQAIGFFNRAVNEKRIVRRGIGSGIHYLLNGTENQKVSAVGIQFLAKSCKRSLGALRA